MNKFLHFAVLYFIIGLTFAYSNGNILSFFHFGRSPVSHSPPNICSNTTTVQLYLSQILSVISHLQANSSYNLVLQLKWPNVVSYVENTTNQELLPTNCTTFVANLKTAQLEDKAAECKRQQIASNIRQQFKQVARNTIGNKGLNELDSGEQGEHCF